MNSVSFHFSESEKVEKSPEKSQLGQRLLNLAWHQDSFFSASNAADDGNDDEKADEEKTAKKENE